MKLLFKKQKEESLKLSIEELNEIYYVLGLVEINPDKVVLAKPEVINSILKKVNKLLNK